MKITHRISESDYSADIPIVARLFTEYVWHIGVDLCFQGFDDELKTLPGKYLPPGGRIILAHINDEPVGVVALRQMGENAGEIKRLFVKPETRGLGLGRKLVNAVIRESEKIGYEELYLDTLASMKEAIALYEGLGFMKTSAYYDNPLPDVVYFRRVLRERAADA